MAQRPTDWNVLGLPGDPTPGDPDRIDEVQRSVADLGRVAREIDDELAAVLDKTGNGAFVGQTGDALRDKISGPLRDFVQSVADGFEKSARALTTYAAVVRDQQWRADNALSQGRGLPAHDARLTQLTSTAKQAGTAQRDAGRTAGSALTGAARGIRQPVSDCDLFWEAFQWLAIALILPALIFGGPIALIAIGVNLAIFIKTAVYFAEGKASALDLFLSGLGMIAPTTKGLPILELIGAGAKLTWNGIKGIGQTVANFFRGVFTGGGLHGFAFLPGLRDLASLAGGWIRSGGLWVLGMVTRLPGWAGMTLHTGGLIVVQGVRGLPALVRGLPATLGRVGTASWDFARAELGGGKWLRLILPVDAAEIGQYGLGRALRIGFVERGLLGNYRFGAPLLGTAGRTVADLVPHSLHQVDALVDLPRADLARIRLGDWAGPRGVEAPHLEPGGLGLSFARPPAFGLHSGFADHLSFAPDAVRRLDALLDTPVHELHSVRMGDWGNLTVTPNGLHLETGLGVSSHLPGAAGTTAAHAGEPGALHLPGTLGSTRTVPLAGHLGELPGASAHGVHLPSLQTGAAALPHQLTALGAAAPHAAAVHPADLLAPAATVHPGAPHPGGVLGTTAPSGSAHALGSVPATGTQVHGALDLLSTGSPVNRANAPVFGTGGHLGEHRVQALTAHQVDLHLSEFAPPRTAARTPSAAPELRVVPTPVTRVDDALALLDHGGPRPAPASHTPSHTPPAEAAPGRLTGAQLSRLWKEQSTRVAALFGAAEDPARAARLDAWADLTLARHEFGKAERLLADLDARPGSGSRPSPVRIHAQASVDLAAQRLNDRLDRVAALGVDPARMDRDLARLTADSLRERPRLIGGADHGQPPGHQPLGQPQLQAAPPPPVLFTLSDSATAGPNGLRVETTTLAGAVSHRVLDAHDVPDPVLHPVPRPGGGFDLHNAHLGTVQSYDATGRLTGEDVPLTGLDGAPIGRHVHTAYDGQGTAAHSAHDVTGPLPQRVTVRPGGGFDLRDPVTGAHQGFDHGGTLVEEGRPLLGAGGAPLGPTLLRTHDNGVVTHSLTEAGGHTLTVLPGSAGLRVTHPVTGRSVHTDAQGGHLSEGLALGDGAGARGARFALPDGLGGHRLTDAVGGPLPERVTAHPGGGFRVEQPPAVPGGGLRYQRHGADGTLQAHGLQLQDGRGPAGYLEHPLGGPVHPLAPGPHWLDGGFHPDPRRIVTPQGTGFRVDDQAGGYRVFEQGGRLTEDATRLHGPGGAALDQWAVVHTPPGGPRTLDVLDTHGAVQAHLAVTERAHGVVQITDTTADGSFVRYGADGTRLHTGTALHDHGGHPDTTFAVVPEPNPGGLRGPGHLEDAAGARVPHRTVTVRVDGGLQVAFDRPGGPRDGEFARYAPGTGTLTHRGFNVLDNGRRTDHQYVVDQAGGTWQRQPHPAAAHPAPPGTGAFQHGTAEITGNGDRIRLHGSTYTRVEVFERRALPGGGVLDGFRRTDTLSFGDLNRRAGWARFEDTGALAAHGTRRYDTSGFGWRDVSHRGTTVHEYRDGLQKTNGVAGHTFAVRGADGAWTWHRFDGAGRELGSGPRTTHRDGGWTDRLGDGTEVQKQWGMAHGPDRAGHYLEHGWGGNAVRPTWERQSPHGKEVGKREILPDTGVLTTSRWSEQRPPIWVRDRLVHAATPQGGFTHLGTDNRFQVFLWDKTLGAAQSGGVRYLGMDGSLVDLGADGRFVRSTVKLHSGNTLKVGDHATAPGYPPADAAHPPWSEPGREGYRVPVDPGPGAGADRVVWQDRFRPAGGANWQVAREGFADGSVREYRVPPQVDPVTGQATGPLAHPWVQRDAHGALSGTHDTFNDAQGNRIQVTGTGRPDSATWRWTALDQLGNRTSGRRLVFRGSPDPRLPWDDSFRDFGAGGALVRERSVLDGGRWVDSWRGTNQATGGERWFSEKYGPGGVRVDYGAGQQVRRWWNPGTRAWDHARPDGARHFRDEFHPAAGGPALTLREVPPHLAEGDGPLRVREYRADGAAVHTPGTWKEFDHGAVVRERRALGDGTFLEKDAWRGQWRRYDARGDIIAQRTDSGLVWEARPGGGLRVTGNEYDFRGPLTEIRGFGRRIREANRLPWGDTASVRLPDYRNALDGVLPGAPGAGRLRLGEALYQPYWRVLAKKVALEFGQEFVLEFGANLAVNGIVAAANNKPFTGQDVLKSFANAAVGAGVKGTLGTAIHEIRGSVPGGPKSVLSNVDGGKLEFRRPNNHDKNWANEWAGNETPTRWRGGTYDFFFNAAAGGLVGWVNGSMNAAVWGITGADGKNHKLTGLDAFLDGGIAGLAGLTAASSAALAKNAFIMGGGSRLFHRQGFGEFWIQLPFKIFEKTVTSMWLTNTYRARIDPLWYRAPLPAPPAPQQGKLP